jgi:hypothetical protein
MWQPGRLVLGQGRGGGTHRLSDSAGFLKTKISLPIIHRLTDDHVIEHLDLENPGSFVEPPSQAEIRFARARVSGRKLFNQEVLRVILLDTRQRLITMIDVTKGGLERQGREDLDLAVALSVNLGSLLRALDFALLSWKRVRYRPEKHLELF